MQNQLPCVILKSPRHMSEQVVIAKLKSHHRLQLFVCAAEGKTTWLVLRGYNHSLRFYNFLKNIHH